MLAPLVSILVPTYNAEKYVEEAIESLIAQTYKNIEVVVSDDASTDNTPKILQGLKEKYPEKIKLHLQQVNLGVTNNCNFIIKNCSGEFICFFAGDDRLYPNCVAAQITHFKGDENLKIVFHKHDRIDSNSVEIFNPNNSSLETHYGDLHDVLIKGAYMGANGMLVKYDAEVVKFDKNLSLASDVSLIINILSKEGAKFLYLNDVLSSWRTHDSSITNSKSFECYRDSMLSNQEFVYMYPKYAEISLRRILAILEHLNLEGFITDFKYKLYIQLFHLRWLNYFLILNRYTFSIFKKIQKTLLKNI